MTPIGWKAWDAAGVGVFTITALALSIFYQPNTLLGLRENE